MDEKKFEEKKFYVSRMFFFMGIALILGIPFALFVPVNHLLPQADIILHRVFNGLLYGGVLVFSYGGYGIASNLGGFALLKYSIKKTWQVVYNRGKADLGDKKLGTYDEYLASMKKKPEVLEIFLGGLIPAVVSFVASAIMYW